MNISEAGFRTMVILFHWFIVYFGFSWGKGSLKLLRKNKPTPITKREEYTCYIICITASFVVAVLLGLLGAAFDKPFELDKNYCLTSFAVLAISSVAGVFIKANNMRKFAANDKK